MEYKSLIISSQNTKLSFLCNNSNSGFNVHKIHIPFLGKIPANAWAGYIDGVSINFIETTTTGEINTRHVTLALSPFHVHPTFEFDFFVPEKNKDNFTSVGGYSNKLEIELNAPGKTKEFEVFIIVSEHPTLTEI